MQALAIVDPFDEAADLFLGMGEIAVGPAVDFLCLERLHEALCLGVVGGTGGPAHAGLDAGGPQQSDVIAAGVLDAPIGVVDEAAGDDGAARRLAIHGINNIIEGVRQIRGQSHNQVPGVRRVLVSGGASALIIGTP